MNLSESQIGVIRALIDQSELTLPSLKDDVLDHICCIVEDKMEAGEAFEYSLECAMRQLSPGGLDEIQRETDFLLNENTIPMKKLMYAIGLATSISFTMGLMMKLLHMPGGEELINFGFLGFALLYLPMLTVSVYRSNSLRASHEKFKIVFGIISAFLTGLAVLFKMLNLATSELMLMAGATVFSFGFLPLHFYGMYRRANGKTV